MSFAQRPLNPHFGIEVEGLVAGPALEEEALTFLRHAIPKYGVVLLRDQKLTGEELAAFSGSLGTAYITLPTTSGRHGNYFKITNLDDAGNILPPDSIIIRRNIANEFWHTDMTYTRPRATFSTLYGSIIPASGGETQYCDTRRAYERLPEKERNRLAQLTASHSVLHSRKLVGFDEWTEAELKAYGTPVERPLVQYHAESGRHALCLASYICKFSGLDEAESLALVEVLMAHATASGEVYTHNWRVGDILIWDNRCTMHRARPYDFRKDRREMITPARVLDLTDV